MCIRDRFNKMGGKCKKCLYLHTKDKRKPYTKRYIEKNKEKLKLRNQKYYNNNTEKLRAVGIKNYFKNQEHNLKKKREYYIKNKEEIKAKQKTWRSNNKPYLNAYRKNKRETDNNYKLRCALASRILTAIYAQKTTKSKRTLELIGCSLDECRRHIELQFKEGMTWENHSFEVWHIDHIKPCASFDLTDPKQQEECFNYTNLQPLWAEENLSKSSTHNFHII